MIQEAVPSQQRVLSQSNLSSWLCSPASNQLSTAWSLSDSHIFSLIHQSSSDFCLISMDLSMLIAVASLSMSSLVCEMPSIKEAKRSSNRPHADEKESFHTGKGNRSC